MVNILILSSRLHEIPPDHDHDEEEEGDNHNDECKDEDDEEEEEDNDDDKNYDDDECKDGYGPILSVTKIPLPPELVDSVEYVNQLPGTRLNLSEGR